MALIDCPECNRQISSKAVSCPHCGYPISGLDSSDTYSKDADGITEAQDAEDGKNQLTQKTVLSDKKRNKAPLIILTAIAIALFVFMAAQSPSQKGTVTPSEQASLSNKEVNTDSSTETTKWNIIGSYRYDFFESVSESQRATFINEMLNDMIAGRIMGTFSFSSSQAVFSFNKSGEDVDLVATYSGEMEGYPTYETESGVIISFRETGGIYLAGVYDPQDVSMVYLLEPYIDDKGKWDEVWELAYVEKNGERVAPPYIKNEAICFTRGGYEIKYRYNSAAISGTYTEEQEGIVVTELGGDRTRVYKKDGDSLVITEEDGETLYYKQSPSNLVTGWPYPAAGIAPDPTSDLAEARRILSNIGFGGLSISTHDSGQIVEFSIRVTPEEINARLLDPLFLALGRLGLTEDEIISVIDELWNDEEITAVQQETNNIISAASQVGFCSPNNALFSKESPCPQIRRAAVFRAEDIYIKETQVEKKGFLWNVKLHGIRGWDGDNNCTSESWTFTISSPELSK